MKKLFTSTIILGIFSTVFFTSCEQKYCYECITERYYVILPENTIEEINTASKMHCNETKETIREVEIQGTHYTTYKKDGKIVQEHTVTNCK